MTWMVDELRSQTIVDAVCCLAFVAAVAVPHAILLIVINFAWKKNIFARTCLIRLFIYADHLFKNNVLCRKIKWNEMKNKNEFCRYNGKCRPISAGIIIHCVNAGVRVQLLNFDFSPLHSLCKWRLLARLCVCVCLFVRKGKQHNMQLTLEPFLFLLFSFWLNTHCNQFSIHLFRSAAGYYYF